MFQQLVGPVVHDASDQGLHVTELAVHPQHQQHHEEDSGPDHGAGEGEDEVWVGEEDQAWPRVDNVVDGGAGDGGHVAQDGEDEDPSEEAGEGVDDTGDDGVPETDSNYYV